VPLVEINCLFPNGGEQTRIHIHVIFFAQQKIFLDFGSMEDSFLQKWMNGHGGVFWRKQYVISSKLNKRINSVKVTDMKIRSDGTYTRSCR
jgi:hypothetical protein